MTSPILASTSTPNPQAPEKGLFLENIMLDEVSCGDCGEHICWMIYTGPTGSFFCDVCAEKYEDEEKESENT